jgi:hypothetical protein
MTSERTSKTQMRRKEFFPSALGNATIRLQKAPCSAPPIGGADKMYPFSLLAP